MSELLEKVVIRCPKCNRKYRAARNVLAMGVKCRNAECGQLLTEQSAAVPEGARPAVSGQGEAAQNDAANALATKRVVLPNERGRPVQSERIPPTGLRWGARVLVIVSVVLLPMVASLVMLSYVRIELSKAETDAAHAAREEAQAEIEGFVDSRLPGLIDERVDQATQQTMKRLDQATRQAIERYVQAEVPRMLAEAEDRMRGELSLRFAPTSAPAVPIARDEEKGDVKPAESDVKAPRAARKTAPKAARPKVQQEQTDFVGTWLQLTRPDQHGVRTMSVQGGGRGTLTVEFAGLEALILGSGTAVARLQWTMNGDAVSIKVLSVRPAGMSSLIRGEVEGTFRVKKESRELMELTNAGTGESFQWKRR